MSLPPDKRNQFIDPIIAVASLQHLAREASHHKVTTIDLILLPTRLGWRDHNKPHGYRPAICTLETRHVLESLTMFTAHDVRNKIEAALRIHNNNLET